MEPEEEYEFHVDGWIEASVLDRASEARRKILSRYDQYKADGKNVAVYQVFRQYEEVNPEDWR